MFIEVILEFIPLNKTQQYPLLVLVIAAVQTHTQNDITAAFPNLAFVH